MPHAHSSSAASSGGDDLGSTDEVKVFKDEGDGEDEKRSSENLLEEKSSLIDWTESEEKSGEPYPGKLSVKSDLSPVFGKFEPHPAASFNMGYLMAPYPYPNGGAHPLPVSMFIDSGIDRVPSLQTGKMGLPAGGSLSLFCPGGELGQPPPAHMGIPPPYQLDSKLAAGLARTPMYPFPGGTYPYPMLSPEMSQVAASWHTPSMYPISSAASGFRSPYPTSLPISSSSLSSELYRFSPTLGGGLGLGLGPALVPPPPSKSDLDSHHSRYARSLEKGSSSSSSDKPSDSSANSNNKEQNKKPHIKKPLNAFMLYMKEMRAKVVAECTLKESAAINQILGRRWHSLSREEQAKYYEKARQERQLHMQLYPGWSARDNYGYGSKKKKRKKDRSPAELGGNNLKKCRARYGLDQQNQWCKPCRRKKKCVRYMEALAAASGTVAMPMATPQSPCSEEDVKLEEMSDASSSGDADTPLSASSPGGLSALSSLASPASEPAAPPRHPVGTNPRDANNPLSVGQLTSQTWPRAAPRPGHEVISVS
ncbi:protein pangolin, isoforms A/H/I/S isoform X4 [Helicoverpa armigera]|uniref:protein pangolin, isoforms A/H/I/S isoform X4 n=1 Tax=Helicoverpa armigera TaxID=29058 RepID=UPI000B37D15F|nr:protein pangolin, isoforms A/H/I/S isoform X4 [Helicoverpa armigera]XP_047037021.1 protein pangolin, isoforms A/H/I/S isoform X4 [Helicoverpa zea]